MKAIVFGLAIFSAATVSAQAAPSVTKSQSSGWFLGGGVENTRFSGGDAGSATISGAGTALLLGYGLNDQWGLFAQVSNANINHSGDTASTAFKLTHLDFGARVHFLSGASAVVPFAQFGVSLPGYTASANGYGTTGTGTGVFVGGGLNAYVMPFVAVSGAVTLASGRIDNFQFSAPPAGGAFRLTSTRLHLGVVYFH